MAQLLASPYSYFADTNGAPLAGGKVYTYSAGTTTPKDSYTDSSGGTPAANPVILDSGGKSEIWLSGTYKIIVKDSLGNTIHTTDNVVPVGSSASGSSFTDSAFSIVDDGDATKIGMFQASSITTATTRTYTMPDKNGIIAMTSDISGKIATTTEITDTTDISLSQAPTQANIGSTASITIPTKGLITISFAGEIIISAASGLIFGIRIGSTNYWPTSTGSSTQYLNSVYPNGAVTLIYNGLGNDSANANSPGGPQIIGLNIAAASLPTGVQTIQLIVAKSNGATVTIKGTVVTSRLLVIIYDHS